MIKKIKNIQNKLALLICVLLPILSNAQMGGPAGFGGQGGLPDQGNKPGDVPFDSTMSWLLIAAGLVIAIRVLRTVLNNRIVISKK